MADINVFINTNFVIVCLVLFFVGFFGVILAYAVYTQLKRKNLIRRPVRNGSYNPHQQIYMPEILIENADDDNNIDVSGGRLWVESRSQVEQMGPNSEETANEMTATKTNNKHTEVNSDNTEQVSSI